MPTPCSHAWGAGCSAVHPGHHLFCPGAPPSAKAQLMCRTQPTNSIDRVHIRSTHLSTTPSPSDGRPRISNSFVASTCHTGKLQMLCAERLSRGPRCHAAASLLHEGPLESGNNALRTNSCCAGKILELSLAYWALFIFMLHAVGLAIYIFAGHRIQELQALKKERDRCHPPNMLPMRLTFPFNVVRG